jgi:hypothetical protein
VFAFALVATAWCHPVSPADLERFGVNQFPSATEQDYIRKRYRYAVAMKCEWIEARSDWRFIAQRHVVEQMIEQSCHAATAWDLLDDAARIANAESRGVWLTNLRICLGPVDYYLGRMPEIVAVP